MNGGRGGRGIDGAPPARREDDVTTTCPVTGGGQRGERATSTMALIMMNTWMGVSGVCVWRIPGMGDGGDCGVTATTTMTSTWADHIPPPRRQRRRASWRRGCILPAATGSGQRRERATSTMAVTTNMSTGVSGVRIGRILGMGDGGDCGVTVTTMMKLRRADRIPPH